MMSYLRLASIKTDQSRRRWFTQPFIVLSVSMDYLFALKIDGQKAKMGSVVSSLLCVARSLSVLYIEENYAPLIG